MAPTPKPKRKGPGGNRRKPGTLTPLQERFVEEYMVDACVDRAAVRAGSSLSNGPHMIRLPAVKAEIQKRQAMRAERLGITADRTLVELARIAYADIADVMDWRTVRTKVDGRTVEETIVTLKDMKALTPAQRAAIASVKQTAHGLEVKFHDKKGALDSLAKNLGLFQDSFEVKVPVQFIIERAAPKDEPPVIDGEVVGRG